MAQLKTRLSERPILALYDSKAEIELHTDASKWGLGGILMQKSEGSLKPVEYFSRTTTLLEQKYHSFELETLAVVEAVKRFRIYLLGVRFKVVTDCASVRTTMSKRDLNPRIARWWMAIQEYDMDIEYRPGVRMSHVDALSRNPVAVNVRLVSLSDTDWFLTLQLQDSKVQSIMQDLGSGQVSADTRKHYCVRDSRLFKKTVDGDRLYVPSVAKLQLLRKHHDEVGHIGAERCLELLRGTYYFPKMRQTVQKYVHACMNCAYAKGNYGRKEGFLHSIERRTVPMDTLHIDHVGPFSKSSSGNVYILVIVDGFTKFVWAKPARSTKSREVVRQLSELFGTFGYPRRIVSDRGLAFTSKEFKEFVCTKGMIHVLTAIATPRANGQVERVNRTIIDGLAASASDEGSWDRDLNDVVWGINHTISAGVGCSPASLIFVRDALNHGRGVSTSISEGAHVSDGASPILYRETEEQRIEDGQEVIVITGEPIVDRSPNEDNRSILTEENGGTIPALDERLSQRLQRAHECVLKAAKRHEKNFNRRRKKPTKYSVDELVLWRDASTSVNVGRDVNDKLANKYDGPFRVAKVLSNDRYVINSIKGIRGYKRFSATVAVDALRRYSAGMVADESSDSAGE